MGEKREEGEIMTSDYNCQESEELALDVVESKVTFLGNELCF